MFKKRIFAVSMAVCILILFNLTVPVVTGASSEEPLYQRRNLFGTHNLKDGGPSIASGMQATKQLVGNGFVFDWVFDFEPWVAEAFKRNLIPCIRVQEGRGGALPDPDHPAPRMDAFRDWFVRAFSEPATALGTTAAVARE